MSQSQAAFPAVSESIRLSAPTRSRLEIVDLVRGLAVAFMALDHTRDYFTNLPFEPEDLNHTWPLLFLVRWITHFCAPAFFLLMGAGAFLYGSKAGTTKLRHFLLTRGAWLIVLEFTIVGFAWTFKLGWGMFGVLWALGVSMILLACLAGLPLRALLAIALALIIGHDAFDTVAPGQLHGLQSMYLILHHNGAVVLFGRPVFVLFPLVPWCAVTMLGFCLGRVLQQPEPSRKRFLILSGLATAAAFFLLRLTNLYGNPVPPFAHVSPGEFHLQSTFARSLILFLDVEKYPPSLQYLLMTLAPILLLLSLNIAAPRRLLSRAIITFGRTPLFFYLVHLYVIHLAALAVAFITRQPYRWLLNGAFFMNDLPDGYGHNLAFVLVAWLMVLVIMYPLCRAYLKLKQQRKLVVVAIHLIGMRSIPNAARSSINITSQLK